MRFLVLLFYYNRPSLVKNALLSLIDSTYQNFEVAFIDDSSDIPGEIVTRDFLSQHSELLSRFKFFHTNDTKQAKDARGGSNFGMYANRAIQESNADIGIILCDDDALFPTYLSGLCDFFRNSPAQYVYSHLITFNPAIEDFNAIKTKTVASDFLRHTHPINPFCAVDSSQVAWRLSANKIRNCWFPYPQTANLDAAFYAQLYAAYGDCIFSGLISQFKAQGPFQLGVHGSYDRVD